MFFKRRPKDIFIYFTVISTVLLSTFILWLPFLLKAQNWFGIQIQNSNFQYVYKNFDGLLYVIPAKTFYNPEAIKNLNTEFSLPLKYYAAHLPFYPLLIRFFSIAFGYLKSMIFVNLLSTVLLACFFYFLLVGLRLSKKPLLLTVIFLFLPRFLVIRSIGAPESLFMLLVLVSLYFFEKERYLFAGIAGALAAATKTPGILLFFAYSAVLFEKYLFHRKFNIKSLWLLLIPIGLLSVFLLYFFQYKDFFAFFHTGGVVPIGFPFSVFNFRHKWVGTAWLEDIIFYFFVYLLATLFLKNTRYKSFFYFSVIFLTATVLVQHRDISRYSLPLWPLACIAFEQFFTSRKFLLVFLIMLPAIYLYSWNFMVYNVMPVANWAPFL